jgi:hypothetical protein
MPTKTVVQRPAFQIAIIGLVFVTTAGCSQSSSSPGSPSAAAAAETTLQGDSSLGPQLAAVRAATARFHDVDVAMAAGYLNPAGRVCDQIGIGAMGIHSPNPALQATQTLDPLQPEVLLYLPKPGGGFRLIGVEYIQFVLVRNLDTGVVGPWTTPAPWPSNYQVVTPTPQLFGKTFDGPMPGHFPGMPWHWDLHAWIWAENPTGVFSQWNPSISCS